MDETTPRPATTAEATPETPQEPIDNSSLQPQVPPQKKSKKKLVLGVMLVALVLSLVAVLLYFRTQKASAPAQTSQQTLTTQKKSEGPYSILLLQGDSQETMVALNPDSGQAVTYMDTKGVYYPKLSSDKSNISYSREVSTDKETKRYYMYRNKDGQQKTLYTSTAPKSGVGSINPWDVVSDSGKTWAIYNSILKDGDKATNELFIVGEDGKKQLLLTREDTEPQWYAGIKSGLLVPSAISEDEKKVYLSHHACIQCDGGGWPDIYSVDVVSKKVAKELTNPDPTMEAGSWTYLGHDRFLVNTNSVGSGGLGMQPSYEVAAKEKHNWYVYDANTKKLTAISKSQNGTAQSLTLLGQSDDKQTAYFSTHSIKKSTKPASTNKPEDGGSASEEINDGVKSISLVTGQISPVALPAVASGKEVSQLHEYQGDMVYVVGTLYQPFFDTTPSKSPDTLYILKRGQKEASKLNAKVPASSMYFVGFIKN